MDWTNDGRPNERHRLNRRARETRRLGHSVAVPLKVDVSCIDGAIDGVNVESAVCSENIVPAGLGEE